MKKNDYTIATLGSHSALQILKGAYDEGFKTLLITTPDRTSFYKRFYFIQNILEIPKFADFPAYEKNMQKDKIILIPHGSFVAYLGIEGNQKISLPYFGSRTVLEWEASRDQQEKWLRFAGLILPKQGRDIKKLTFPILIKTFGAAGGQGYVYVANQKEFKKRISAFKNKRYILQEYIVGVTCYLQYFYSPITKKIELLGIDRRYETNVDGLGRLPASDRIIAPSYVVVGNSPLVIRESLLPKVYEMGEAIIYASKKLIDAKGIYGPFCLETIITPDQKFYTIEISTRIVAGSNMFVQGSPYSALLYDEPMSTGRRIAREIKIALQKKQLQKITG